MAKQLNVNLAFTADTNAAKQQIQALQQQLTNLVNIASKSNGNFPLTKEIQQATTAAAQLKAQIQGATDINTGKLDLTKFTQSMISSGTSLKQYQQQLSQLGPMGDKAFASLATSINNADARLKNANGMLNQFATTLKNTARWQISSSILHGFMGSLQSAYGYAQNLNQSLNNIRIVTGASTDEMAAFAGQANKAAQALSTTTTQYTDAALIYYQQGIRDEAEIAERTETTIKLANVSRQSAEDVSQQMTAIWNNFDDGSKALEYYADGITALGATTASSSQEIATGLEKFAAIAKTVGLSFEYATAAMATITAQTRQSADTVGTGLRTIFSRLDSLSLGETLEDGVTLDKYSEALNKVGVQILDVNGDIKNMDIILDELGAHWNDLSDAQQIALAKTVGGVRQYTNLIALMDNYDKMQENVLTAKGAEGTLQEQADIYAESWEAAQKRVRAAWEEIYQSVFDDKFFIKMTNGLAGFVHVIDDAIDGLGGMKGVLLLIGSIITKMFNQDITNGIAKITSGFQLAMMGGQKYVEQQRKEANDLLAKTNIDDGTRSGANIAATYQAQGNLQNVYLNNVQKLSAEQQHIAQFLLDQNKILAENAREQAMVTKAAEEEVAAEERLAVLSTTTSQNRKQNFQKAFTKNKQGLVQIGATEQVDPRLAEAAQNIDWRQGKNIESLEAELTNLQNGIKAIGEEATDVFGNKIGNAFNNLTRLFQNGNFVGTTKELYKAWDGWNRAIIGTEDELKNIIDELTAAKAGFDLPQMRKEGKTITSEQQQLWNKTRQEISGAVTACRELGREVINSAEATGTMTTEAEMASQAFRQMAASVSQRIGQGITATTSALISFGMALSSIKSLGSIWSDEDISLGDKLISTMTSLGMVVSSLTIAFNQENIARIKGIALNQEELASLFGLEAIKEKEVIVGWKRIGVQEAENQVTLKSILGKIKEAFSIEATTIAREEETGAIITEAGAEAGEIIVTEGETVAKNGLAAAIWKVVAARLMEHAAILPVIAAAVAAVAAIALLIKVYNADAEAAKKASEKAEEFAEKAQEAQQAADELKGSIDQYDSCIDKLAQCTKGTQEWRDALKETGESALKAMTAMSEYLNPDEYSTLISYYREHKKLNEDLVELAQKRADAKAAEAQYESAIADKESEMADTKSRRTDLSREIANAQSGSYSDGTKATSGEINKNLDTLLGTTDLEDFKDRLRDIGVNLEGISNDTLIEWRSSIEEMSAEANNAAQTLQILSEAEVERLLGDNSVNYSDAEKSYAATQYESISKLPEEERLDELNKIMDQAQQLTSAFGEDFMQNIINGLDTEAKTVDLSGYAATLTNKTLQSLSNESNPKAIVKALGFSSEDIDTLAEQLDVSSETILNNLVDSIKNAAKDYKDIGKDLSTPVQNAYNILLNSLGDINLAEAKNISSNLQQIFEASKGNMDNVNTYAEALKKMGSQADEFEEKISTIDWQNADIDDLQGLLNDLGHQTDFTTNEIYKLLEALGYIKAPNEESISPEERYSQVTDITQDLEYGDTITKDQYDTLKKFGLEVEEFFDITSRGEYRLKESSEALQVALDANDVALGGFTERTKTLTESLSMLETLKNGDFNYDDFSGKQDPSKNEAGFKGQLGMVNTMSEESGIDPTVLAEINQKYAEQGTQVQLTRQEINALAEAYSNLRGQLTQEAIDEKIKNINEELNQTNKQIEDANFEKITKDLDPQELKETADYLMEIRDNANFEGIDDNLDPETAEKAAASLLRYNKAVEKTKASLQEWNDALDEDNKDLVKRGKAITELGETYEDLLNMDGLSQQFASDAHNLELLDTACNESGEAADEAYQELQALAILDIADKEFNLDTTQAIFNIDNLESLVNTMDDVEIGCFVQDQSALDALSGIAQAAAATGQDASTVLSNMFPDYKFEIEDHKVEQPKTATYFDAVASIKTESAPTGAMVDGMLQPGGSADVSSVTYDVHPSKVKDEDMMTVSVPTVKSAKKTGGGSTFKRTGAGGGGGGGCFVAGTLISTNNGFLPIERIQPGDIVLSYNEQTKQNEYSEVFQTMIHYLWTKLHKIYIGNEIIQTTEIHRFYIKRAGLAQWLPANDLRAGDLMYLASGEWQAIDKIEIKKRFRKVYNFEVSHNHNYYVSETKVLAHNKGGCFIAGTLVTTDQGFKNIENIQIGDIVLSYDEQKKQNVYSQVAQTMIHFVKEPIYTLYIANETLKVTGIHRFFIKRNNNISWIHASDIQVGDFVLFANGTWNEIFKIESKFRFRKVYNFEVSNTHNYYVGKNQILAHNKGRGGGRRAERMRVQKVDAREGQERYYKVTKQLNVLQHAYDKVAKAADRAFGKEKLKNIEREIKAQEKLIQKQKEYTKEINDYVKSDRKRIQGNKKGKTTQKYWSENENKFRKVRTDIEGVTGKEVNFDENGVVTNYNAVIKAINKWYNKQQQKAKKYSEGSKKGERIKEQSKAQRDMMIENLNQYAESVELKLEEDQKLIDMQNELYDQRLEKTNLILKLRIDVADDSLKLIDNLFEQIGDSAFKAANRIALIGKQTEITASKVMGYRQGLLGIFENHGVDGADMLQKYASQQISAEDLLKSLSTDASGNHITEAEIDSMRDMLDGLLEQNTQLLELRKNVIEEIGTVMDENIDRLDRITDKMEYLKDISNSYKNIIDLTGRNYLKISSQVYKSIESANVNLAKKSVEMAKERMDQANEQYNYLVSQYQVVQDELSDQEKDGWQERIKEAQDYVQSMTQDYYSSWEDAIEAVNTKFETSMTLMAEDFSKAMAKNMGSLEALQSRMDLKKEIADVFVPEYEKMYQLSKLVSDAQKAIDESSNVKVRRELQKVQEKILATRQDEQKISQYEIDYLQKELELKKAQLALEEANQVKSQVRMSRDSEGNFSYVYTADEKAVQDAEDEYNAKLYEMQKLNEEYITSLQDQLVSVQQSYIEAMQEAAETYGIGTDEYTKAVEAISKEYNIYFNELTAQMQTSIENQQTTQQVHAEIYKQITNDIYQANVDLTTAWNDTNLAALTGFQSLQEYQEAWKETNSDTLATAIEASEEWGAEMTAIYAAAGQSVSDFSSTVSEETDNITQEAQKLAEEMGTALEEVSTNIDSVIDKVVEWEQEHSSAIQKMIEENNALIISLQKLLAEWSGVMNTTGANSLADLEAQIAAAQQAVDEAAAAKSAARETKRRAKDKMRRSNTRQVRKYRKYKNARRKVRDLRSKLKRARKGTRKYNKLRKQLRRARITLKRAKRAVKRTRGGIKGAKKAFNKYNTNVKAYNAAKENYNTVADTYNDALKKLEDLKTEYDALKNVPIIAGDSKLNPTVSMSETADYLSPTTSTTNTTGEQVSNYVDTMVSALKTALSSVSPTVKIDTLPELKQNVSMEVNFPNVTDPIEAVHETFSSIGTAASLFIGRKN